MMKIIGLFLITICSSIHAFAIIPNQKLPQVITYSCDPSIEPRLITVLNLWNRAVDGYFTIIPVNESDHPVLTVKVVGSFQQSNITGLTYQLGNSAFVQVTSNFNLTGTMLHECGHALGLAHSTDPHSIMFSSLTTGGYSLDQDDMNGIRSLYGLSPKTINFYKFKQSGRRLIFKAEGNCQWDLGDGTTQYGAIIKHKFPKGIYWITAVLDGFCEVNKIEVKR